MPTRPLGPCWSPGCGNRADCATHRRVASRQDQQERGTAAQRGYDADHRRWRTRVLERDPWCRDPERRHRLDRIATRVADHIVPLREWQRDEVGARGALLAILHARGRYDLPFMLGPWSIENGQGLCLSCHNAKAQAER